MHFETYTFFANRGAGSKPLGKFVKYFRVCTFNKIKAIFNYVKYRSFVVNT